MSLPVSLSLREKFWRVGSKERDGEFGACFLSQGPAGQRGQTGGPPPLLYCARPGSRIWEASFSGDVLSTHQFKQPLACPPLPLVSYKCVFVCLTLTCDIISVCHFGPFFFSLYIVVVYFYTSCVQEWATFQSRTDESTVSGFPKTPSVWVTASCIIITHDLFSKDKYFMSAVCIMTMKITSQVRKGFGVNV